MKMRRESITNFWRCSGGVFLMHSQDPLHPVCSVSAGWQHNLLTELWGSWQRLSGWLLSCCCTEVLWKRRKALLPSAPEADSHPVCAFLSENHDVLSCREKWQVAGFVVVVFTREHNSAITVNICSVSELWRSKLPSQSQDGIWGFWLEFWRSRSISSWQCLGWWVGLCPWSYIQVWRSSAWGKSGGKALCMCWWASSWEAAGGQEDGWQEAEPMEL